MEFKEFGQAWEFLGLQGSPEEIKAAFQSVDKDGSGVVDRVEFCEAVKGSRMAELSLSVLLTQMDGHLEGMDDFFADYKKKKAEADAEAAAAAAMNKEKFAAFLATARRRRLMKKQNEIKVAEFVSQLTMILHEMTNVPDDRNPEERKMYVTVKDTFNAFDRDGNAELAFPEYYEAWKFLGQPGSDDQIKQAFDSVDVDATGLVDFEEFIFSIMQEKALKYGVLADMERLKTLLGNVATEYGLLRESMQGARMTAEERAAKNKRLRDRLENMKGTVTGQVNELLSKMLGVKPEDVLSDEEINAHLTNAFNKFDVDNSG